MKINNKYNNICDKYYKLIKEKCIISSGSNVATGSNMTTANIFVPFNTNYTSLDLQETDKTECELLHIIYSNCLIFQENKNKNNDKNKNNNDNK